MKTRNIIFYLIGLLVFCSCDDMFEPADENNRQEDAMYEESKYAHGLQIYGYDRLPYITNVGNQYNWTDVATDDAVTNLKSSSFLNMTTGTWASDNNPMSRWDAWKDGIQYINIFLSKVDKVIIGLGILYVVVAVLYVAFDKIPINYRPILQPGETELETSFPSTHTLVICTVLGSGIVAAKRLFKNEMTVRVLKIAFIAIMAIGVCARLFAGVHWLTDIVAGLLFSVTLVSLYTAWIGD
jgi:hypothetical protein